MGAKTLGPGDDRGFDTRLLGAGQGFKRGKGRKVHPARGVCGIERRPAGEGDGIGAKRRRGAEEPGVLPGRRIEQAKMAEHPACNDFQMPGMGVGRGVLMLVEDLAQVGVGGVRQEKQPLKERRSVRIGRGWASC